MQTLTATAFKKQMRVVFDKVNEEHTPVIITQKNGKSAVLISLDDFSSYEETNYLMASPKNAERLSQSITEIEAGLAVNHPLIEE
ncbi:MAG: type II toxin-antitoxin system prevent-host-death family antitoxin [Methylococcaceae bacterium]|nr:type II toxin-antitoxin system prevent-host-death family antitoxin [Methylococcaceae bacterium]